MYNKNIKYNYVIVIKYKQLSVNKEVFLKIVQISQKTPVLEFLFNKVTGPKACNVIKNWLQHRCFPMKIANFLRTLPVAASENN